MGGSRSWGRLRNLRGFSPFFFLCYGCRRNVLGLNYRSPFLKIDSFGDMRGHGVVHGYMPSLTDHPLFSRIFHVFTVLFIGVGQISYGLSCLSPFKNWTPDLGNLAI